MKEQLVTKLPKVITAPVLIIAFNRPDTLQKVFDRVRQVQPQKFYFAVDGPRPGRKDDVENCRKVQEIVKQVDWTCEIHTLFRKENVGCGRGPAEAISWAFEHEDRLIILEDDCVAALSFFGFCEELLERYKDDTRIWNISGRSHQHGSKFFDNQDYIFSRYAHTNGWATWKRCWNQYDIHMSDFPEFLNMGGFLNTSILESEGEYANKRFLCKYENIEQELSHSWDSQWGYLKAKNGGLGIVPCKNLIHNIGIGNGTHTSVATSSLMMEAEELPEMIKHPFFVLINRDYELQHYNNHIKVILGYYTPTEKVVHKVKKILKKLFV